MAGENLSNLIATIPLLKMGNIAARGSVSAVALFGVSSFDAQPSLAEGLVAAHISSAPEDCPPDWTVVGDACLNPDSGYTVPPDFEPSQPAPASAPAPKEKEESKAKHKTGKKIGVVATKLPRHISQDQCGWGHDGCASGCGVAAGANATTDLTGYLINPTEALPIIGDAYLSRDVPGSGGTSEVAFSRLAKHFHFKETSYDIDNSSDLKNTARVISEMGGVAIGLFRDGTAVTRSGKHSKIAMNGHYVVLDRYLKNGFGLADSHKGGKDKNGDERHNERTADGKVRAWTAKQLFKNGLVHVWTLRRTSKTPLNPKYAHKVG